MFGQLSAPSPREMYEADPEEPPNLHSSFSLDSLDTIETLKIRKITFSWNLPEVKQQQGVRGHMRDPHPQVQQWAHLCAKTSWCQAAFLLARGMKM